LEQELNLDDGSAPLFASSMTLNDWTEAGTDSETIEFFDLSTPGVYDPSTKVQQKFMEDEDQFWFMASVIQRNNEQPMSKEENLLPPKIPKDTRRTLVLDLDETLIHPLWITTRRQHMNWSSK